MTISCNLPLCVRINKSGTKRISFGTIPKRRSVPQPEIQKFQTGMAWPLSVRITSVFGWLRGNHHDGIDIAARKAKPIVSAANGIVGMKATLGTVPNDSNPDSFGNYSYTGPMTRTVNDLSLIHI